MKESDIRKRDAFNRYLELSRLDINRFFSDRSMFEYVCCPACGAEHNKRWAMKEGFRYVECERCFTIFANPRPHAADLSRFYRESESTSFWVNEFFKPVAEVRRVRMFRPRAEHVASMLGNKNNMVGDVGAGFGLFLDELKKVRPGSRCVAIEPEGEMANICRRRGMEVIESAIEDVKSFDGQFDVLTSFEMFEHLYSPREMVKQMWRLLRPGGRALVTMLNGCGFDIMLLGERSKSVSPPHHLNFFNPSSVRSLFEDCGFKVEQVATPGKLDWNIVEGMYRDENVDIGPFWTRVAEQVSTDGKKRLQRWIVEQGLSSHMRLLARKDVP